MNAFLMPTEGNKLKHEDFVELVILRQLGLENIQLILVPAQKAYEGYLNGIGSRISFPMVILEVL